MRISATDAWPNASEVFALEIAGVHLPLLLIAIMTFILITSSGTMAMAVNMAYRGDKRNPLVRSFLPALRAAGARAATGS